VTQGLRKVESSMLKECGKEKARRVLHPKCRSEKRKVSSFPFLHFSSFLSFFLVCVFFFLLENKKMPRKKCLKRNGRNRRPKAKAKSERAEQKLETKFLPFSAFFFSLWFLFSFFFCLKKRRCQEKMFEIEGQK